MSTRTVNNTTFTSAMEDGSQTAELRAVLANMYIQNEFVHGLPLKVAQELYQSVVDTIHTEGKRNEEKLQAVSILIHNLQVRIANTLNTDNLLGLACIYFYMDGEDPLDYTGSRDTEKIRIIKSGTKEDIFFFVQKACEYTPQFKTISDIDLAACLTTADTLIASQRMNTRKTQPTG